MSVGRPLPVPGLWRHLRLLWGLRLRLGLNRTGHGKSLLAALLYLVSAAPGIPLFFFGFRLLHAPAVATSAVWTAFLLNLLCFVTFCVWCAWPLLSAGVDDHSEVSRYRAFPVSPLRLLIASTVASQAEPRALVFASPLFGASLAVLWDAPRAIWLLGLLLLFLFALLTAAWSRVAIHLVLNVLRAPNSAQILGAGFFGFLALCTFIPPVDVSWLTRPGSTGIAGLDWRVIDNAARALGRVPPGFLGMGLIQLQLGRPLAALRFLLGIGLFCAAGLAVAYGLLLQFYRGVGRTGAAETPKGPANPFGRVRSRFGALLAREALDLWHNPRLRLLVSVPFVLSIFFKVLSGRALFAHFLGLRADAWLMGGLALYGAVVVGSTFAQNAFAYDGFGMAVFLSAPVAIKDVLRAKNVAHAGAGLLVGLLALVFYRLYFGSGDAWDAALAAASLLALVPVVLAAGNFLSATFPVKFHANLQRQDRLPLTASLLGIVAATLGCAPFVWVLRSQAHSSPGAPESVRVLVCAAVSWSLYAGLFPVAVRVLERRREAVFQSVTRD